MRKSVSPGTFQAGGVASYTVVVDTSEYTSGSNIVITDVLPDGMCPLGGPGTNYVPGNPATCAGATATTPSVAVRHGHQQPRRHVHRGVRPGGGAGQRVADDHLRRPDAVRLPHRAARGRADGGR